MGAATPAPPEPPLPEPPLPEPLPAEPPSAPTAPSPGGSSGSWSITTIGVTGWPAPAWACCNNVPSTWADGGRSAGSTDMPDSITSATASGTRERSSERRSPRAMRPTMSSGLSSVSPRAARPSSSSNRVEQSPYTSVAAVGAAPSNSSGAPCSGVNRGVRVVALAGAVSRAIPKSPRATSPDRVRRMFCGLTSPWTTSCRWVVCRAPASCTPTSRTRATPRGPSSASWPARVPEGRYSMTR